MEMSGFSKVEMSAFSISPRYPHGHGYLSLPFDSEAEYGYRVEPQRGPKCRKRQPSTPLQQRFDPRKPIKSGIWGAIAGQLVCIVRGALVDRPNASRNSQYERFERMS